WVSTALAALTTFLRHMMPLPHLLMTMIDFLMLFLAIAVLFGLILKVRTRGNDQVEGSSNRSSVQDPAVCDRQVSPRTLPGTSGSRLCFRSRSFTGGDGDLDQSRSNARFHSYRLGACWLIPAHLRRCS